MVATHGDQVSHDLFPSTSCLFNEAKSEIDRDHCCSLVLQEGVMEGSELENWIEDKGSVGNKDQESLNASLQSV